MARHTEQAPSTEKWLSAALKAQHNQAHRADPRNGLHDLVASLPPAEQATVVQEISRDR